MANALKYPSSAEEFCAIFPKSDRPQTLMHLLDTLPKASASSKFDRQHLQLFRVIRRQQAQKQMEAFFGGGWDAAIEVTRMKAFEEFRLYSQAALEQRPVAELLCSAPRFGAFYAHLAQLFVPAAEPAATSPDPADDEATKSRLRPRDKLQTPKRTPGFVSGAGLELSGSEASSSSPVIRRRPGEDDINFTPDSAASTESNHYGRAKSEAATVQMTLDFLTTVVSLARASTDSSDPPATVHQPHRQLEWTPCTTTFNVEVFEFSFTAINDGSLAWAWHDGTKRVRDNRILCSLEAKAKYMSWLPDGITKGPLPDTVIAQWVAQFIGMISQDALGDGPATGGE